ncbi:MAG TPA: DNA polymerase III subunit gamma/tau [Atribacteraceae bacterium]|nr:DNA polymerase III subunit gamma/tau [Atribacteraceae bacterium]
MHRIERSCDSGTAPASYQSMYRKWRPRSFQALVGQDIPVTILVNSLTENRISHAYLFCGPRGIGKTTTARILAMSLNCPQINGVEPCGACETCRSIQGGSSLDVVEIDAASHRGIDEIRDLREKVKYMPLRSRYKVYIIDEVHMLTNEAFNALLKTLEEPPAHVVFVLVTTEPQRLPDTIVSRCSRINFNKIDLDDTVGQLRLIAQTEGLSVDDEILFLIARKADGALRDAESFLEQIAAWGGPIDFATASRILREVDPENLDELFFSLSAGKPGEAIIAINQWLRNGLTPEELGRSLLDYFRTLLVAALIDERRLAGISERRWATVHSLIDGFSVPTLKNVLSAIQKTMVDMRRSLQPQVLLELAIFDIIKVLGVDIQCPSSFPTGQRGCQLQELPAKTDSEQNLLLENVNQAKKPEESVSGTGQMAERLPEDWWLEVLAEIKKKRISLYAFLQEAVLRENESSAVTLAFRTDCRFHKESVERKENYRLLTDVLEQIKGGICRVECLIDPELPVRSAVLPIGESASPRGFGGEPPLFSLAGGQVNSGERARTLLQETTDLFAGVVVHYISVDDHSKGGWGDAEYEKPDERSPENAG